MTEAMISDGDQLVTATKYQFQSYLRTLRFLVLFVLIVLIILIVFLVENYYVGPSQVTAGTSPAAFEANALPFLLDILLVGAILLGGDAISTDFGARTGYYTLVLPVRRWVLFLGRYIAATLTNWALMLVYIAGATLITFFFFGAGPGVGLLGSILLLFLYAAAATGLAFFFSSLSKSPAVSIVLTFIMLFIVLPIVTAVISGLAHVEPWFSLTYGAQIVTLPLVAAPVSFSPGMYFPTLGEGIVIMVSYLVVALALGYVLYEFKESTG